MSDDDDLPDSDYASIYGHAALDARRRARQAAQIALLDDILAQQDARIAALDRLLAAGHARRDRPNGP